MDQSMAIDLVQRLRVWHTPNETITGDVQLYLDAANRIEWLEQRLRETTGEAVQANDRIDALEAVLREIAGQMLIEEHDEDYNGDYEAGYEAIVRIARAAIAPEQDK